AAASDEHARRIGVIGALAAILLRRAPELRHVDDEEILPLILEIEVERAVALGEILEETAVRSVGSALTRVKVPAADVHADDANRGPLEEHRRLEQFLAEAPARVLRAVLWRVGPLLERRADDVHRVGEREARAVDEVAVRFAGEIARAAVRAEEAPSACRAR